MEQRTWPRALGWGEDPGPSRHSPFSFLDQEGRSHTIFMPGEGQGRGTCRLAEAPEVGGGTTSLGQQM